MYKFRWWELSTNIFFWQNWTPPKKMFWPYVGICILFCVAGAVNSGWSQFALAIPFAAALTWLIWVRFGGVKASVLLPFFAACVIVSNHQDSVHMLYPGLGGQLTLTEEICLVEYSVESYRPAYRSLFSDCEQTTSRYKLTEKLPKHSVYKVKGISHNYADMGDRVVPMIMVQGELLALSSGYRVQPDLRARWAHILGLLMIWPISPLLVPALFQV
jgi:hypothetical protein